MYRSAVISRNRPTDRDANNPTFQSGQIARNEATTAITVPVQNRRRMITSGDRVLDGNSGKNADAPASASPTPVSVTDTSCAVS